ncbi:MAG: acetoacetate decarboxylase family protein [Chloroflexi bacterium]|nr:acetoacetate decarboxylase family protein [Chloroflexota bacterium]
MKHQAFTSGYPSTPWRMRGGAWIGLFQADRALPLPSDLAPLLGSRSVVVALIRYLDGTLRYDECIVGSVVRRGALPGMYIRQIWVDSLPSLRGGRAIWGLPKQMARFSWHGSEVAIADADGPIATLRLDPQVALLPRLPLPIPLFGCRDGRRLFAVASATARLGRAGMQLASWSERFPYRLEATPTLAIGLKPFRLTIPAPRILSGDQLPAQDCLAEPTSATNV